jgi:HEAT repeat protein
VFDFAAFLEEVNENYRAKLYRCRHSASDVAIIVPKLTIILDSKDHLLVDEAMRSLCTIGTPAEEAAIHLIPHLRSEYPITRELAILTLGNIAHKRPDICLEPTIASLDDERCRPHAIRILAFLKQHAKSAIPALLKHFESKDAKTRKAVLKAVVEIEGKSEVAIGVVARAKLDKSAIVRSAAGKSGL